MKGKTQKENARVLFLDSFAMNNIHNTSSYLIEGKKDLKSIKKTISS